MSDPAKPVPFQDKIAVGMSPEYMVEDQRALIDRLLEREEFADYWALK